MAAFWPYQPDDNAIAAHLNAMPKYVATRTLRRSGWNNSHLLIGDLKEDVAKRKADGDGNVVVLGSRELFQQLIAHDLIDEYRLFLHPLVLGTGKRLFRATDRPRSLRLLEAVPTTTGVLMLSYATAWRPLVKGSDPALPAFSDNGDSTPIVRQHSEDG